MIRESWVIIMLIILSSVWLNPSQVRAREFKFEQKSQLDIKVKQAIYELTKEQSKLMIKKGEVVELERQISQLVNLNVAHGNSEVRSAQKKLMAIRLEGWRAARIAAKNMWILNYQKNLNNS